MSPAVVRTSTGALSWRSRIASDAIASTAFSNDASSWAEGRGIEQQHDPARRGSLVLAHHELTEPGARTPVDASRVVTRLVVAQREELAGRLERRNPRTLGARVLIATTGASRTEHGVHAGPHDDVADARDLPGATGEPQRIGDDRQEGAELVPAAVVGRDAVRRLDRRARPRRRQDEAGGADATVDHLRERDERRACRRLALEDHAPLAADVHSRRAGVPADLERRSAPHDVREREEEQEEPAEAETGERPGAEHPAAEDQGDRRAGERPAASGGDRTAERRRHAQPEAPGTGTAAVTARMMSTPEMPRSAASGETMSRCSSTDGASSFTSSGMT